MPSRALNPDDLQEGVPEERWSPSDDVPSLSQSPSPLRLDLPEAASAGEEGRRVLLMQQMFSEMRDHGAKMEMRLQSKLQMLDMSLQKLLSAAGHEHVAPNEKYDPTLHTVNSTESQHCARAQTILQEFKDDAAAEAEVEAISKPTFDLFAATPTVTPSLTKSQRVSHQFLPIYHDLDEMKNNIKDHLKVKPVYKVEDYYKDTGICQKVARSAWFEFTTFAAIICNAIYIWVETDLNDEEVLLDAHPVFIFCEQAFCTFFTWELAVRFASFERKCQAARDYWFIFDTFLVSFMVLEAWVLTLVVLVTGSTGAGGLGDLSIIRLARLLRLCRMLRVARLLRQVPELFILVKAIMAASRATFFTLFLLFVVLYIYSVLFVQLLKDSVTGDKYFRTVYSSMLTLFLQVALTDELTELTREVSEESTVALVCLFTVLLICTITIINMLIGVLVEAISAVAENERTVIQVQLLEQVLVKIFELDLHHTSGEACIAKHELAKMVSHRSAVLALDELGIDVMGLVDMADHIFDSSGSDHTCDYNRVLTFEEFMDVLLQLRGSNKATVKDIVESKKLVNKVLRHVDKFGMQLAFVRSEIADLQAAVGYGERDLRP